MKQILQNLSPLQIRLLCILTYRNTSISLSAISTLVNTGVLVLLF
jgi:hypothetical protein